MPEQIEDVNIGEDVYNISYLLSLNDA